MTWDDVVALAETLPEVAAGTAYGTPALRVRRAFMCRLREDGETLAIRCDFEERPFLIEANDGILFVTPHYQDSPMVLVALPRAGELVRELPRGRMGRACAESPRQGLAPRARPRRVTPIDP
jgi:hypothetical protein